MQQVPVNLFLVSLIHGKIIPCITLNYQSLMKDKSLEGSRMLSRIKLLRMEHEDAGMMGQFQVAAGQR